MGELHHALRLEPQRQSRSLRGVKSRLHDASLHLFRWPHVESTSAARLPNGEGVNPIPKDLARFLATVAISAPIHQASDAPNLYRNPNCPQRRHQQNTVINIVRRNTRERSVCLVYAEVRRMTNASTSSGCLRGSDSSSLIS